MLTRNHIKPNGKTVKQGQCIICDGWKSYSNMSGHIRKCKAKHEPKQEQEPVPEPKQEVQPDFTPNPYEKQEQEPVPVQEQEEEQEQDSLKDFLPKPTRRNTTSYTNNNDMHNILLKKRRELKDMVYRNKNTYDLKSAIEDMKLDPELEAIINKMSLYDINMRIEDIKRKNRTRMKDKAAETALQSVCGGIEWMSGGLLAGFTERQMESPEVVEGVQDFFDYCGFSIFEEAGKMAKAVAMTTFNIFASVISGSSKKKEKTIEEMIDEEDDEDIEDILDLDDSDDEYESEDEISEPETMMNKKDKKDKKNKKNKKKEDGFIPLGHNSKPAW